MRRLWVTYICILSLLDVLHPVAQEDLPINMWLPRQVQALVREEAGTLGDRDLQFNIIDIAEAAEGILFPRASSVLHQLVVVFLAVRYCAQRDRRARFLGRRVTVETTYAATREGAP